MNKLSEVKARDVFNTKRQLEVLNNIIANQNEMIEFLGNQVSVAEEETVTVVNLVDGKEIEVAQSLIDNAEVIETPEEDQVEVIVAEEETIVESINLLSKVRLLDIAKEIEIKPGILVKVAKELGISVVNHMSTVSLADAEIIKSKAKEVPANES